MKNNEKTKNADEKCEKTSLNPGWIKRKVPDKYADEGLQRIILFFVINTPCVKESSSSISMSEYGWNSDVWKNETLRKELLSVADLERDKTLFVGEKLSDMKSVFENAEMKKGFQTNRKVEKVAFYKTGKYASTIMNIFLHIRNSLAHGRLAMYKCGKDDVMLVLEDGVPKNKYFEVRSRMILKKSTLLKWIDIITAGPSKLESNEKRKDH